MVRNRRHYWWSTTSRSLLCNGNGPFIHTRYLNHLPPFYFLIYFGICQAKTVPQLFLFSDIFLEVEAYICKVGREKDETQVFHWVLPCGHLCECTKILMGGMNTWTPIRPFKPTYVNSPLLSDDVDEIRTHYFDSASMYLFLGCSNSSATSHTGVFAKYAFRKNREI